MEAPRLVLRAKSLLGEIVKSESLVARSFVVGLPAIAARGAGVAMMLASNVLLARLMGASEFGVYSLASVLAGIAAQVATCGVAASGVQFIAMYKQAKDWALLHGFVRFSLMTALVGGLLVVLAMAAVFAIQSQLELVPRSIIEPLLFVVAIQAFSIALIELQRAFSWPIVAIVFPSIILPGQVMILSYAISTQRTLDANVILWVGAGSYLLLTSIQCWTFLRRLRRFPAHEQGKQYEGRRWVKTGLPIVWSTVLAQLTLQLDSALVGIFLPTQDLGIYRIISLVAYSLAFIPATVYVAAGALLSAAYYSDHRETFAQKLSTIQLYLLLPIIACGGLLLAFPAEVLGLFGRDFEDGRDALLIVVATWLFRLFLGPSDVVLVITGNGKPRLIIECVTIVLCLVTGLLLIPAYGIIGAAFAHAITWSISGLALYALMVYHTQIRAVWHQALGNKFQRP